MSGWSTDSDLRRAEHLLRISWCAATAVLCTGLTGWVGAVTDVHGVGAALLLGPATAAVATMVYRNRQSIRAAAPAVALWLVFSAIAIGFVLAVRPSTFPRPDGAYVYKADSLSVSLQRWAGDLPPDNLLPTAVASLLVDDVDFRKERPVMPGQEVTNRPVGAALVISAILRLGDDPLVGVPVGRFDYVGTNWPDVTSHISGTRQRVGLAVGVTLNGLIALPIVGLASLLIPRRRFVLPTAGAVLASPLLITQTIFTWPKAASGFFLLTVVLSAFVQRERRVEAAATSTASARPAGLVAHNAGNGLLIGLAWWMHPTGLVLAPALCVFLLGEWRHRQRWTGFPITCAAVGLTIAPWIAWTKFVAIPSNLLEQNQAAMGLFGALRIRVANLLTTTRMPNVGPDISAEGINRDLVTTIWGAGGLLLVLAVLTVIQPVDNARATHGKRWRDCLLFAALGTGLIAATFGVPQVIVLHGMVVVLPLAVLSSVGAASTRLTRRALAGWGVAGFVVPLLVHVVWTFQFLDSVLWPTR